MLSEQFRSGTIIRAPPPIYNFTDQAFLKDTVTAWPSCISVKPQTIKASSFVDLEASAAKAHPEACTSSDSTVLSDITQGSTNTCSAMAFAQAYTIKFALQFAPPAAVPQLSPLFAYYYQRVEECRLQGLCPCTSCISPSCTDRCDPPCVDCGSTMQAAASIYLRGVCSINLWPLSTPINSRPTAAALAGAMQYAIEEISCVAVGSDMADSVNELLVAGNPVVVFLNLDGNIQRWMQALVNWPEADLFASGVQMPTLGSTGLYVGHVVVVVGFDPGTQKFIVRNSFGFSWGVGGRFTITATDMNSNLLLSAVALFSVK